MTTQLLLQFSGHLRDRPAGRDPPAVPEQPVVSAGRRAGRLQVRLAIY